LLKVLQVGQDKMLMTALLGVSGNSLAVHDQPTRYKSRQSRMTPELDAAIAAIQPLSSSERRQLLYLLTQSDAASDPQTDLKTLSSQFWEGSSLQQLRATQTPTTVHSLKHLAADFWPAEDSIEDFLAFLQQQRQEVI
jgi:hypothetical protein